MNNTCDLLKLLDYVLTYFFHFHIQFRYFLLVKIITLHNYAQSIIYMDY